MAHFEIAKDSQRQLTTITVTGETMADDIERTIVAHNQQELTRFVLWDLSQATFPGLSSSHIEGFVDKAKEYIKLRAGGKTAIVVPYDYGFGLARTYDILQEINKAPVAHITFRNKEEALRWLSEKQTQR